jgi:hypothetical protein
MADDEKEGPPNKRRRTVPLTKPGQITFGPPNFEHIAYKKKEKKNSLQGMLDLSKQDYQRIKGIMIAKYNKFFDKEGKKLDEQFQQYIVDVGNILGDIEDSIENVNDPDVYIKLAKNPTIKRLVIETFKLEKKQMGREGGEIRAINESTVTDPAIGIVLASILLDPDGIDLTSGTSATKEDLEFYLRRLIEKYNDNIRVGGNHFRKTKYSRKRKTKRRHSTRRKTRRKRRTRRK